MRTRVVFGSVVVLALLAWSQSVHAANPPCNCPLFTIDEWPPDALYYCDYFATSCNTWTDVGYYVGQFSTVPWQNCGADCAGVTNYHRPLPAEKRFFCVSQPARRAFLGIPNAVSLEYRHKLPVKSNAGWLHNSLLISSDRNHHFIHIDCNGSDVFAKVFEVRLNRALAKGNIGLSDAQIQAKWESRFIAYEVEKNPALHGFSVDEALVPKQIDSTSRKMWKATIEVAPGKSTRVLILLVREKSEDKQT